LEDHVSVNAFCQLHERHCHRATHFDKLLSSLRATPEDRQTLIDRAMDLYGSNMGNANSHVTTNLPVIFAGGGFRHGQHLAFDTERNYPLPNLYVSMLQQLGIETERFASPPPPAPCAVWKSREPPDNPHLNLNAC
jgi:hypothetical protein